MTALTENRYTKHRDGLVTAHPVKAGAHIYKGALVCADSTGYGVPGADTADYTFLGVALEEADNSAGQNGDLTLRVYTDNGKAVRFYEACGFKPVSQTIDEHTGHLELLMKFDS